VLDGTALASCGDLEPARGTVGVGVLGPPATRLQLDALGVTR